MSTRSVIAIRNTSGDYDVIYCHWDGYPENNGRILHNHYNTLEKAQELIALGDLSSLAETAAECKTYKDRGDDWDKVKPSKVYSYRGVKDYCDWAEFMYIWIADNADEPVAGAGSWTCVDIDEDQVVILDNL